MENKIKQTKYHEQIIGTMNPTGFDPSMWKFILVYLKRISARTVLISPASSVG